MIIFVRDSYGKKISFGVESIDSIGTIKEKIQDKEGIPFDEIILCYKTKWLEDNRLLCDYNI